jgi:hypothetical protein
MIKSKAGNQIGSFDSWPLKVKNRQNFLVFRKRATYRWKALDKCYNFSSDLIAIEGLHMKLWVPKVARIPVVGISGLPLGSPKTNAIWMWPMWRDAKNTLRGMVVASPKSESFWVLWIRSSPWLVLAPKVLKLCTNHFVLVLCMFM